MEHWTEQVVLHTLCSIGHWDDNDLPAQICPLDHPHVCMLSCKIMNKTDVKVLRWQRLIKVVVQLSYSQHMAVILVISPPMPCNNAEQLGFQFKENCIFHIMITSGFNESFPWLI